MYVSGTESRIQKQFPIYSQLILDKKTENAQWGKGWFLQ